MPRLFDPESPLMEFLAAVFDFFAVSLTALLCALPVVTAGASLSALYGVMGTFSSGGAIRLRDFFQTFRAVFRRATLSWSLLLAAGWLLYLDLQIVAAMGASIRVWMLAGLFFLALCLMLAAAFLFPMLAANQTSPLGRVWKRALFTGVAKLPRTLAMLLLTALPLLVLLLSPTTFWLLGFLWVFLWPALSVYLCVKLGGMFFVPPGNAPGA